MIRTAILPGRTAVLGGAGVVGSTAGLARDSRGAAVYPGQVRDSMRTLALVVALFMGGQQPGNPGPGAAGRKPEPVAPQHTVVVASSPTPPDSVYVAMLERTNQQLDLQEDLEAAQGTGPTRPSFGVVAFP